MCSIQSVEMSTCTKYRTLQHPTSIWSNNKTVSIDSYSDTEPSTISVSDISFIENYPNALTCMESYIECSEPQNGPLHSTLNYPLNSTQIDVPCNTHCSLSYNPVGRYDKDVSYQVYNVTSKRIIIRKMKQFRKQLRKHGLVKFHMLAVL